MQKKKPSDYKGRRNRKNSSYRGSSKSASVDAKEFATKDGSFVSSKNDWRWYATNPQLVKDAASYPFGYALGTQVDLGPYGAETKNAAIPGIMAFRFVPTVGYSNEANSPINVASRKIFSEMRKANAGSTNYDPVDMMVYLVAMDSCYMYLEYCKRVYGVARSVSPVNRYFGEAIVTSMGVDYDSLTKNLDDFRAFINTYAQKLKNLVVPNGMSFMAKHQWMVSGIYQDNPTDKSQLYLFVPDAFYKFGLDNDGAGMLVGVRFAHSTSTNNAKLTYTQLVNFGNDLLNPILANQDFAIMSGDILKWRGEGGVVVPSGITETYQIFPTYDETVLDQIQNMTILGMAGFTDTTGINFAPPAVWQNLMVKQDSTKSWLVATPWFRHPVAWVEEDNPGRNVLMSNRIVNFDHDNVMPESVMEATRLSNIANDWQTNQGGYDWFMYTTLGSEAITKAIVFFYQVVDGNWQLEWNTIGSMSTVLNFSVTTPIGEDDVEDIMANTAKIIRTVQQLDTFHRHPYVAVTSGFIDNTVGGLGTVYLPFRGFMGDINFYTVVDRADLKQMSEVALMSEFNVRMES